MNTYKIFTNKTKILMVSFYLLSMASMIPAYLMVSQKPLDTIDKSNVNEVYQKNIADRNSNPNGLELASAEKPLLSISN